MNDEPVIAPMFPEDEPTRDSPLDELATYALIKQDQIFARDKKNAEDLWLMGRALKWAKGKMQHGEWEKWWKTKGLKKTYIWQAKKLNENAATLEDVKGLGVTEALIKFGVVAVKTKAAGGKKNNDEAAKAVPARDNEAEEPTLAPEPSQDAEEQTEAPEPNNQDDGGDPAEGEEEDKELKAYQESIRTLTPKTRAVAIHHALELLRDELDGAEVDEELLQTFGHIAKLAEELKGLTCHDQQDS